MTPTLKMTEHIVTEEICAYCGERVVMPEESLCFDCQRKIKDENLSWISKAATTEDNKQLWLPGFRK
jgi:hypothetical protein